MASTAAEQHRLFHWPTQKKLSQLDTHDSTDLTVLLMRVAQAVLTQQG